MVLHQIVNNLSHTTRHHIGSVGEENGTLGILAELRIAPLIRLVLQRRIIAQSPIQLFVSVHSMKQTILLISSIAAAIFVAWKPMVA